MSVGFVVVLPELPPVLFPGLLLLWSFASAVGLVGLAVVVAVVVAVIIVVIVVIIVVVVVIVVVGIVVVIVVVVL